MLPYFPLSYLFPYKTTSSILILLPAYPLILPIPIITFIPYSFLWLDYSPYLFFQPFFNHGYCDVLLFLRNVSNLSPKMQPSSKSICLLKIWWSKILHLLFPSLAPVFDDSINTKLKCFDDARATSNRAEPDSTLLSRSTINLQTDLLQGWLQLVELFSDVHHGAECVPGDWPNLGTHVGMRWGWLYGGKQAVGMFPP